MTEIVIGTEVRIARPAETVWDLVAGYHHDPRWRRGVDTMVPTPAGPVTEGTVTDERMRFAGRGYHNLGEVVTVGPGLRFSWRTTRGVDADGTREVIPLDPGHCLVRLETRVRVHGAQRLLAPVFAVLLQRNLTGDGRRLRALAENPGPPRVSPQ